MNSTANNAPNQEKSFLDVPVSSFLNAYKTEPQETTLRKFLSDIKDGKYRERVGALRKIRATGDIAAYKKKKELLPAVSLSALLTTRAEAVPLPDKLISHSHLIQVDVECESNGLRDKLQADPYIAALFTSPSGEGIKGVVRIDGTRHLESFLSVEKYFSDKYKVRIDPSVKDVPRLCFASYDPEVYINESAKILPVTQNGNSTPASAIDNEHRTQPLQPGRKLTYGERALETARMMIERSIDGEKYNTLLKAGELLGGYVAGGILSKEAAENMLRNAIDRKPNVQCFETAYKAITKSIEHGRNTPIEFEELERQRIEYLEQNALLREEPPWPEGYTKERPTKAESPPSPPEKSYFSDFNIEAARCDRFIGTEPKPIKWILNEVHPANEYLCV